MRRVALTLGLLAALAAPAPAGFLTYTETLTGSGTFGGTQFTNALVTLTQTADTSTVVDYPNVNAVTAATSTVTVAGVGTGSFTDNTALLVSRPSGSVALYLGTSSSGGLTILASGTNGSLATYDLRSSVGPTSAPVSGYNPNFSFTTTAGAFRLTSVTGAVTFQASAAITAAPAPPTLVMALLGAVSFGGGGLVRRRLGLAG